MRSRGRGGIETIVATPHVLRGLALLLAPGAGSAHRGVRAKVGDTPRLTSARYFFSQEWGPAERGKSSGQLGGEGVTCC